jgi:hypothetical protein
MDLELAQQALAKLNDVGAAERELLTHAQVDCPVVHHFGPGVCIREVFMPAGTIAIGHRQKFAQLNIMIKGKVLIAKDDGTTQVLSAPMIFTGKAGRKIGYVMEDMIWQNVYPTDLKDASAVEDFFIEKSEQWHGDQASRFAVESVARAADRNDYMLLLEECGIPHSQARQQSENEADQMWVESAVTRVDISPIEGKGLFATTEIKAGDLICPARIDGKRTQAGRFTNHSLFPNAKMVLLSNGDIDLVAIADIEGCKGGSIGTEITIDYRQALSLSGVEFKQKESPCLV